MARALAWVIVALVGGGLAAALAERGPLDAAVERAFLAEAPLVVLFAPPGEPERSRRLRDALREDGVAQWIEDRAHYSEINHRDHTLASALWRHIREHEGEERRTDILTGCILFIRDGDILGIRTDFPDGEDAVEWLARLSVTPTVLSEVRRIARAGQGRPGLSRSVEILADHLRRQGLMSTLSPSVMSRVLEEAWQASLLLEWSEGVSLLSQLKLAAQLGFNWDEWRLRESVTAMRDTHEADLRAGEGARLDLAAWILLNQALGDNDRIVEWVRRNRRNTAVRPYTNDIRLGVFDTLVEAGEWEMAGETLLDPSGSVAIVVTAYNTLAELDRKGLDEHREMLIEMRSNQESESRSKIANLYTACLAAERWNDAEMVLVAGSNLREELPLLRLALVMTAADVGVSRDEHVAWLDEIEAAGVALPEGLREKVRRSLAGLPR